MKTTITLVLVLVCLLAAACAPPAAPPPQEEPPEAASPEATPPPEEVKPEIEVTIREGILEEVESTRPQEVLVYEVVPGDPSLWIENLADVLGTRGEMDETEDLLLMTEGDRYLEVRKVSSAAFYGDLANLWTEEPTPDSPPYQGPGDDEATELALDWLSRLGFSPDDIETLEISVSDETLEITLPESPDQPISVVVGKNIAVRRRLDGLLVLGPGSKIKLYVGGNGEVDGFTAVWRQILPTSGVLGHRPAEGGPTGEMMTCLSAEEAFGALVENPLDHLPLALVERIDVDKVDFGYYSRSAAEEQAHLQPVYVFYGTAYATLPDGSEVSVPYEQFVVALAEPLESIWPEADMFEPVPRSETDVPPPVADEDEEGGQ